MLFKLQKNFLSGIQNNFRPAELASGSRFDAYVRAYRIRLKDSLKEDFPETLGQVPRPDHLLDNYIDGYPSTFWTLGEFAKFFPSFIRDLFPDDEDLHFQVDLEWARWVVSCIGEPVKPPTVATNNEIKIILNPSIEIVEVGRKMKVVYFFNGEVCETFISEVEVNLLKQIRLKKLVSKIDVPEDQLVELVQSLTAKGVIIGFEEAM